MNSKTSAMALALAATTTSVFGVTNFLEDFDTSNGNWRDSSGLFDLNHVATGGPDGVGDAHVSSPFAFANGGSMGTVLFRAQDEFNSSGGAFEGDWILGEVEVFSVWVRHDAPTAVSFFTRFATPANFPGTNGLVFSPVLPNTWTELVIPIDEGSSQMAPEGGPGTFASTFSNVGHVQVGVSTPGGFENDATTYTFDLDKAAITVVPEPGSTALLALGTGGLLLRRRRGRSCGVA